MTSRNVQACHHVAGHAALELIPGNSPQLTKNVLPIRADVDVGIGRVEGNSLIRVENKRPCAGSVLDAIEWVCPLQGREPSLGIESERDFAISC